MSDKAKDVFRPSHEPHRTIYDAFQDEASKRAGRTPEEWILAERLVVWGTAKREAAKRGMTEPTLDQVQRAELLACGHCDYGLQWVRGVVDAMREPKSCNAE